MNSKELIKSFLNQKPGYRRTSVRKLQKKLSKFYGFSNDYFNLEDIREVRGNIDNYQNKAKQIVNNNSLSVDQMVEILSCSGFKILKDTCNSNIGKVAVKQALIPSISDQVGMHIVLGCVHVPFHNKKLHEGILELLSDYKNDIKGFHLIGDFLDLNTLSSHDKNNFTAIPGLDLDIEYDYGNKILDQYESKLNNNVWKTYLYGNHEDRYNRWMKNVNNAKTPLRSPEEALNLVQRGYCVKTSWQKDYFTLGNHLDIFHGIYFNVHSAKKHMDAFRGSCMYAHTHRTQMYVEGNTASFNIGSCADFDSQAFNYASRGMKSQWSNGFAIVMISPDGSYNVTQVMVDKFTNEFYFGGKKY